MPAMLALPVRAQDQVVRVPERPAQGSYILDEASLLNAGDAAAVQASAAALDQDRRMPIVVVTLNALGDYVDGGSAAMSIERYEFKTRRSEAPAGVTLAAAG